MSIENRAFPFSRSARTLIKSPIDRHDVLCRARSAGACPPRTLICLNQDIQDSQDFQDEGLSRQGLP